MLTKELEMLLDKWEEDKSFETTLHDCLLENNYANIVKFVLQGFITQHMTDDEKTRKSFVETIKKDIDGYENMCRLSLLISEQTRLDMLSRIQYQVDKEILDTWESYGY